MTNGCLNEGEGGPPLLVISCNVGPVLFSGLHGETRIDGD